jgi:hypothetical protein
MFIPDPDFYPSRNPDPKTATKERGKKCFQNKIFTKNLSKNLIFKDEDNVFTDML